MPSIDIRRRSKEDVPQRRRSVIVSPDWKFSPPGSRWGGFTLSWNQLRQLARLSPTVQAIIALRQSQVASFMRAPRHKGDRGFEIIRADGQDMTEHDEKIAHYVFEFLMRTGRQRVWDRKSMPGWAKELVNDVLVIGASTTELVYDEDGRLSEFWAIDAGTIELQWAERYIPTTRYGKDLDQPVRYVQVVDGQIETEYAEDEIMYLYLNPLTDITRGGYPMSPTEAASDWLAAEVLALQYNSNYFDHGSVPPGILAIVGNMSEETLQELNVMWETDVKGVVGQHKPVALSLEPSQNGGSSIQWLPMKNSNRDMEMGDFLDKLTTKIASIFLVDPVELGQRSAANSGGISASDNTDSKIDLSRDKGLIPFLDMIEQGINEFLMTKIAPGYVFRFTGINAEDEMQKVKFLNEQMAGGAITVREWRKAMGLDEAPPGTPNDAKWLDAPANPALLQIWMQENGINASLGMKQESQMASEESESDELAKSWMVYGHG
ncbi:phage portal protein [Alicyclobacillus tolerans]|uniref:phage portal protein n=1 Tax=Alicyclobacillus tolerans TaxID=90970 RepID=UPI003B809D85